MEPERGSEVRARVQPFQDALAGDATLDELALSLAAVLRPGLDLIGELATLDELAADCPTPTRDGVMHHLFGSGRFRGDADDYHAWQNSCLDHVLATQRGMPITLSIVGIEVGRRVGVRLVGVGMPGHFLIGDPDDRDWFADPYHGRSGLDRDDCRTILRTLGADRWSERFLDPSPDRAIAARILNNLRLSCERRRDRVRLALVMAARAVVPEIDGDVDELRHALAVFN